MLTDEFLGSITDKSQSSKCKPSFRRTYDRLLKEINDMNANFPTTTAAKTLLLRKKAKLATVQARYLVHCGDNTEEAKMQFHFIASHARLQLVQHEVSAPWISTEHNKHNLYHSLRKHLYSTDVKTGLSNNTYDSVAITEPVYMLTSFEEGIDLTFDLILDDEDMFDKKDVIDFFQTISLVPFIITYVAGNSALVPNSKRLAYATSAQTENVPKINPTLLNEITSFDKNTKDEVTNNNDIDNTKNGDDNKINEEKGKGKGEEYVEEKLDLHAGRSSSARSALRRRSSTHSALDDDDYTSRAGSLGTRQSTTSRGSSRSRESRSSVRKLNRHGSKDIVVGEDNEHHHHHHHHHHRKEEEPIVEKWKEREMSLESRKESTKWTEQSKKEQEEEERDSRHSSLTTNNLRYLREHLRAQQLRRKWRVVFPFISLAGKLAPQSVHMLHVTQAPTVYGQIPGVRVPVIIMAAPNISVWHGAMRSAPMAQHPSIQVRVNDTHERADIHSNHTSTLQGKHFVELVEEKEASIKESGEVKATNEIILRESDSVLLADVCIDSDDIVYYVEFSIRTQVTGRGGSLCVYSREFLPAELLKYIRPLHLHEQGMKIIDNNKNNKGDTAMKSEETENIKPGSLNPDPNTTKTENEKSSEHTDNDKLSEKREEHVEKVKDKAVSENNNSNNNNGSGNQVNSNTQEPAVITKELIESASAPLRTHWEIPIKADVLFNVTRALPPNASYTGIRHATAAMFASATNMPLTQRQQSVIGKNEEMKPNGSNTPGAAASYTSQPRFLRQKCMLQVDVRLTSMPYQVFRERFPIVFKQDDTDDQTAKATTTTTTTTTTTSNNEELKTHDINNNNDVHVEQTQKNNIIDDHKSSKDVKVDNGIANNESDKEHQSAHNGTQNDKKTDDKISNNAIKHQLELEAAAEAEFASRDEHAPSSQEVGITSGPTRYRLTQVTVTSFAIGAAGVMLTYYQYVNDAGLFNGNVDEVSGVINGVGFAAHNVLNEYVIVPVKGVATLLKGEMCNSANDNQIELANASTVQEGKDLDFTISNDRLSKSDNVNNASRTKLIDNINNNKTKKNNQNTDFNKEFGASVTAFQSNDDAEIIATHD